MRRLLLIGSIAFIWMMTISVVLAGASSCGWPLESTTEESLGFGESYRFEGAARNHTGLDLLASPGEGVKVVQGGVVYFAGIIPSAGGGSMFAITIEDPQGRLWSYLPIENPKVGKGDSVNSGSELGSVATNGDPSIDVVHLHIGLRNERVYVDPEPLLTILPASGGEVQEPSTTEDLIKTAGAAENAGVNSNAEDIPVSREMEQVGIRVSSTTEVRASGVEEMISGTLEVSGPTEVAGRSSVHVARGAWLADPDRVRETRTSSVAEIRSVIQVRMAALSKDVSRILAMFLAGALVSVLAVSTSLSLMRGRRAFSCVSDLEESILQQR